MTQNEKLKSRIRSIAHFTDDSIELPGGYRVGWDGIIGLVPWVGDLIGLMLSAYIIHSSAKLGASKSLLVRMSANAGIETLIGAIPVIGDLFDLAFKANRRNLDLLDRHLEAPKKARTASNWWLGTIALVIILILVTLLFLVIRFVGWAWQLIF